MENLTDVGAVRSLLDRYGFRFSKALGQNFLINPTVCPRMAEASGAGPASGVLEIGPGIGVLTRELAARAGKVVAVELDQRLLPVLEETLRDAGRVKVVHGDVMKLNLAALLKEEFPGYAGGGVRQSPLLHHLPHYHGASGEPLALHDHHGAGAEGGGAAPLRPAGKQRVRGGDAGGTILCGGEDPVSGFQGQLPSRPQGGQRRDAASNPAGAALPGKG